jgi:hypothetical protein
MSSKAPVDPRVLQQGDVALERALEGLDRRLRLRIDAWADRLERDVTGALRIGLQEAAAAHRRLLEGIGITAETLEADAEGPSATAAVATEDEGGEEEDREPDWSSMRRYREGVREEIVLPLLRLLEDTRPGARVSEGWQAFVLELREVASTLPEEIVRTEPADVLVAEAGDGPVRHLRRVLGRAGRATSRVFRRSAVQAQTVPLRALARRELQGERLPGVADLAEELHRHHARALLEVEMGLGHWLREWFPVEDRRHEAWSQLSPNALAELHRIRDLGQEPSSDAPPDTDGEGPLERGRKGSEERGDPEEEQEADDDASGKGGEGHAEGDAGGGGGGDEEGHAGGDTEGYDAHDPEAGEEEPDPGSVALALQKALDGAADQLPVPEPILERVRGSVGRLRWELDLEIRRSGTGLAAKPSASEDRRLLKLRERLAAHSELWGEWYDISRNRLRLTRELLELRGDLDRTVDRLFEETLAASVVHLSRWLGEAREGLLALREEAASPGSPLMGSSDRETVARAAEDYLARAGAILEQAIQAPMDPDRVDSRVREVMDAVVEGLATRLRDLPESEEVRPVRFPVPPPDLEQGTRTVPLRDAVRQSLDALRLEDLRTSASPLLQYLDQGRTKCREIPNVVAYNLGAARDELRGEAEPAADEADSTGLHALLEDARSLTLHGLERTAQGLDKILAGAVDPYREFTERAHGILHRAMVKARERITLERAVQEQIRDVRTLVLGWARIARERVGELWRVLRPQVERAWKKAYIQIQRLIRKGRSAVGAEAAAEGEAERAMEVLRNIPLLLEPLPLVYRRLFSFLPVTDPALLVGREPETAWVTHRWTAWREGLRMPSLLTGPVTVGHTSFLNILCATLFAEARVVRLNLQDRYRSPDAVAERVAQGLREAGLLPSEEGGWTLDRLASKLLDDLGDSSGPPLVILVEHFGHLFLRTPGGGLPAERFLEFQARTSPVVFWLSTASDPFWKLLRKTEPQAAALMSAGTLSDMDRSEMEQLIMTRHQRSGVPLEFLAPESPNPLLKRKLQRVRSPKDRQAILREEFFDRLHRGSQGNIIMAILLWLKSADFTSREGWLQVHPPLPLRFQFLEELDLDVDFALMALLEHSSLTLEEYCRVFRVEEDQAFQTLEVLRGRMLLDRLTTKGGLPEPVETVRKGVRYRIPPILTQVVTQYLRNHNILH